MLCFSPELLFVPLYVHVVGETWKKDLSFEKEFIY
jgi:hypothetical protein